jgi:hypothetical protein
MNQRFLIDYDNPDAGIGHSMGIINRALKIATRNHLQLAYSEKQLRKSTSTDWRWRIRQGLRMLRGKKTDETHNIGDDLNSMLNLKSLLPNREELEVRIQNGEIKVIDIPEFEIHIPSNQHEDDEIYQSIDQFIHSHPGSNIAFRIRNNRFGDYEYASTRDWFIQAYHEARKSSPIRLVYDPKKLNIAVHIRRGDLLPGRQFSDLSSRMLPDAWYLEILDEVLSQSRKPVAIHIFSEGKNGQYYSENGAPFWWKQRFKQSPHEIHEHIDSDFLSAFHHIVHADILVGSKSGMSHLAGTLSSQCKLMPKMWHSYRGSNQLLELPDTQSDLDKASIAKFVKQYLELKL